MRLLRGDPDVLVRHLPKYVPEIEPVDHPDQKRLFEVITTFF